jgi:hypothetical protein
MNHHHEVDASEEIGRAIVHFAASAAEAWARGDVGTAHRLAAAMWTLVGRGSFVDCDDCDEDGDQ